MINVYPAAATDFSPLGVVTLMPTSCTIEEQAGGLFELEMSHPIDVDMKWLYLQIGNIIKAPCAVREAPLLRLNDNVKSGTEVKTRAVYKVTTDGRRLRLRTEPSESAKVLHAYKPGTEVVRVSVSGKWANVVVCSNGQSGWMWASNLTFVRDESETVSAEEETPSTIIEAQQTREQLFRIYSVAPDVASNSVTVKASHIFYDLQGIICTKDYAPEAVAANTVLETILGSLSAEHGFTCHCAVTAEISGDYSGVSLVKALLDPEIGIVPQTNARIIRDNFDVYILPDTPMERGMEIRHRKNLTGAIMTTDASNVVTRIRPVGKDKDGNKLYITENDGWVESANKAAYPTQRDTEVEYDVSVSKDKDAQFKTDEAARAELKRLAEEDFANGADAATVGLEVEFAALENTNEYKEYAKLLRLFLYDSVRVIAAYAGINAKMRVNGYVYDCLLKRYEGVYIGDISSLEQTTYGYEIADGTVSGAKILPNSVNANTVMRRATIGYAKISQAAVEQLSADSITAQAAYINAITAETINTDSLTASWAHLFTLIADAIDTGTVTADTVTAAMAKINTASIAQANIDFAQVKQLKTGTAVADQLITHDATADRYYIDKLQVRALQVLEQTVGSLTVKASDGSYYRLDIDPAAGTVVPTQVTVTDAEATSGITSDTSRCIIETDLTAADLSATNVKAINALIDKLTAGRIDVDELFAREATIGALNSYLVKAETIEALEGQLNVWANEKIQLAVNGDLTPNSVAIGSSITMDADHTEISTPYLDIDVSGSAGDTHIDENGISTGTATFTSLNCDEVVKYYTGATSITLAAGADLSVISEMFRNRLLQSNVTITLSGDVTGRVVLAGISGRGNIVINGGGHTLSGCIIAINNAVGIEITNLTISHSSSDRQCVNVEKCVYVKLYGCILNANSTPSNAQGIRATYSGLFLQNCEFYNIPDSAMAFSYGTDALVIAAKGAATYFLWTDGAVARFTTSRPSGKWASGNPSFLSPSDPSSLTINTGSATSVETPVTTATYTASGTGTYYPSGHWINDNVIRQGYEGSTNGRKDYGVMWFSGASALSGKTIKSATLTLKRISGKGRSSAVTVKLWSTTVTGKSGTMPSSTLTSLGELGSIGNGETVTYTIPTSCIAGLASGGGLVLYTEETACKTGKSYSEHYAHFEGTDGAAPVLTVTYQ